MVRKIISQRKEGKILKQGEQSEGRTKYKVKAYEGEEKEIQKPT
jgi:hypothetical protein